MFNPVGGVRGLSPRVRGNPDDSDPLTQRMRSIPACAGEPLPVGLVGVAVQVYPRVCGGTVGQYGQRQYSRGLSPRVRGNPLVCATMVKPMRSIPACAGEPPLPPSRCC